MGVTSKWVVPIWIFSSVKEQFYDRDVPELRSKAEGEVPVIVASRGKQPQEFVGASEGGSNWQFDAGAPPNECLDRFKLAMERSRSRSVVGVGPMIAKQIDQGNLHSTFAWHPARGYERQCFVARSLLCTRIEEDLADLNDVARESAMAKGVFSNEFQQRGVLKIVSPFEHDMLPYEPRMLPEV